jgi:hypothetical protein
MKQAVGMDDDKVSPSFTVRPFREGDLPGIVKLRSVSMSNVLGGVEPIDSIQNALDGNAERHEAWVAEAAGAFIGLAMILVEREPLVRLKLVCVAQHAPQRRRIRRALVEVVMRYTWESDCLKLVVHTGLPAGCFIKFMHAFGFDFSRERWVGDEHDEHIVEFYRNLYERPAAFYALNNSDSSLMIEAHEGVSRHPA